MSIYWDSSAIVAALHDTAQYDCLIAPGSISRIHTIAEVFSTLTGGRLRVRCPPRSAQAMVQDFVQHLVLIELDRTETLAATDRAQALGVSGGRVHDLLHIAAAEKGRAEVLWTYNVSDFAGLSTQLRIETPSTFK